MKNNIKEINSLCLPGEFCVSIPNGADVAIGQTCYLTVSLIADPNVISNISGISIETNKNHIIEQRLHDWKLSDTKNFGSSVFLLKINDKLLPETSISYTIYAISGNSHYNKISPLKINYTTKKIKSDSLIKLNTINNNEYIEPPKENNPAGTGMSYITYYSKALDYNGKPLRNTQVIVSSELSGQIYPHGQGKELVHIGTEPSQGGISQKITTQSESNFDFFTINSDVNGDIKFRVYPIKDTSVRIDFDTQILNVTATNYAASIYIFNAERNSPFGPNAPKISGIANGKIEKLPGTKVMEVYVDSYPGWKNTDSLIFFMQGFEQYDRPIQLNPIYNLGNIENLDTTPMYFSYDQLLINKSMKIYYLIAPESQEYRYSMTRIFTYIGEGDSSNDETYDKVKVYTSYATIPINVYNNENETFEWHGIILSMINQKTKSGKDAEGLYVVIMGTNDTNNKDLPPLGSSGHINVYVKTPTSRNTHVSYPFQLPSVTDSGKQTGHVLITIPYCDINRAGPSFSGELGSLTFDYYTENSDGSKTYGKKWSTKINTVLPNQDDNDGCDPLPNH
ncbi:hypothetical protein FE394_14075 [Xenorhabdus sp. Reich]|uniref:IgGFc-binding protein N-terminal domain-containing protein n=1 Tax=Xenorhabdus littoralis TaxID=2582835 RepID=A0ABU4SNR3_9GAMM|nr:hypothetical protein [Xenorhabdus sp. Reich]MDX8000293.1 hypothetical protein [Xenorhabdus sp. Reich]